MRRRPAAATNGGAAPAVDGVNGANGGANGNKPALPRAGIGRPDAARLLLIAAGVLALVVSL